jgi:hypothetical protein
MGDHATIEITAEGCAEQPRLPQAFAILTEGQLAEPWTARAQSVQESDERGSPTRGQPTYGKLHPPLTTVGCPVLALTFGRRAQTCAGLSTGGISSKCTRYVPGANENTNGRLEACVTLPSGWPSGVVTNTVMRGVR